MARTHLFDDFFRATFADVARSAALVARDLGTGQELAQEAFVRLLERWNAVEDEEHARRFVYRAASTSRGHMSGSISAFDCPAFRPIRTTWTRRGRGTTGL